MLPFFRMLFLGVALFPTAAASAPFAYIPNFGSNDVSVIDSATDTVVATIPVGTQPYGVAVNQAGTRAYIANSGSNSVSVIDTTSNAVISSMSLPAQPFGIAVNRAGTRLYVTSRTANSVYVINTTTASVIATIPMPASAWGVAVNNTDDLVYVGVYGNGTINSVVVISAATNSVSQTISVPLCPYGIAVNPSGAKLYASNNCGSQTWVIDTATNLYVTAVLTAAFPSGIAVAPSRVRVYVASGGGHVTVFDAATNVVIADIAISGGAGQAHGVAVNPSETRAYVANVNRNEVVVIDTATNAILRSIPVGTLPFAFGQFMAPAQVTPPPVSSPAIPAMSSSTIAVLFILLLAVGAQQLRRDRASHNTNARRP